MIYFTVNKYLLLSFVLFSSLFFVNAQNQQKIDSLKNELKSVIIDSLEIDLYNQIGFEYRFNDSTSAKKYTSKAIGKAESINYSKGLSDAYFTLGFVSFYANQYPLAKNYFNKTLSYALKSGDKKSMSQAYRGLGAIAYWSNQLNEAVDYYFKSLKIAEEINDRIGVVAIYNNLGDTYRWLRKYDLSEKYLFQALKMNRDEFNDEMSMVPIYYNLSDVVRVQARYVEAKEYLEESIRLNTKHDKDRDLLLNSYRKMGNMNRKLGDYRSAVDFYLKGIDLAEERKNDKVASNLINNIGVVFYEQKDYENALIYYRKGLNINREKGFNGGYSISFNNIGLVHQNLHNYDSAEYYFRKCIEKGEEFKLQRALGWGYYGLFQALEAKKKYKEARIALNKSITIREKEGRNELLAQSYNSMGKDLKREKKYKQALTYYNKAAIICKEIKNPLNYKDAAEGLSFCYEQLNKPYQALAYQRIFKQLSDSLLNEENTKKLTQQTMQYEFDKEKGVIKAQNEKEMLLKQNELQRQKYFTYAFVGGFLIVVAFALVVYRNFKQKQKVNKLLEDKNREITEQKEEITNQAEELKTSNEKLAELSQFKESLTSMIVHDLKNPINAIIGLSRNPESEKNKLNTINNSGKKMMNLVLNILDVQKFEETKFNLLITNSNLSVLFDKAIDETSFLSKEKNVDLNFNFNEDYTLAIDFDIILRVIVNIISNAIKYSEFNSKVFININKENGDFIRIAIKDEGRGIPEDQIDYIFDKFWQFKSKKSSGVRSVGLGLTFCKMAVEAHGGKIKADSIEGEWTEISFTVPFEKEVVKEEIKELVIIENGNVKEVVLSEDDVIFLKEYVNEIGIYHSYETTDILSVLYGIESKDIMIEKWKEEVENSVVTGNVSRFEELLKMVKR